jgi:protein-L-isoaspartate(D-aspartate) O-methyltransferase
MPWVSVLEPSGEQSFCRWVHGDMGEEMDFARARAEMVEQQIARRGVKDPQVLASMGRVPRELFVRPGWESEAYEDHPLPIAEQQTISQPYMVAYMIEAAELKRSDRVLEVGTGSGYASAVISAIAADVYTIERHPNLAKVAEARLGELGCTNVEVRVGDGTCGWPDAAPFDAILVTAGGPVVPTKLREQLALGGRLVIPVGESTHRQSLVRVRRHGPQTFSEEVLAEVAFVPLIGEQGWDASSRH